MEPKQLLQEIETIKNEIAIRRDKLNNLYNQLFDLLETLDYGLQEIEEGHDLITRGIDKISEDL